MYADETIAAIATPMGQGGVGIVRISGPLAPTIATAMVARSHEGEGWTSHHLYHGHIVDQSGDLLDDGLAVLMHAPRSYTGEDVLELHCHGSPLVLQRVLSCVLGYGARPAEPGEFTKRAFLNGRLDLTQAEGVIDLVRARTAAGAALAAQQLSGCLADHLARLRTDLVRLKAWLEALIDFSEDDVEVKDDELVFVLDLCKVRVDDIIHTYRHGELLRDGIRATIVGKPNVGKSSLLNALLGTERAIVTEVAGTTRDSIDECADFEGIPVVLSDTAGLRDRGQADIVEQLGMDRTAVKIAEAQILLAVLDASQPLDSDDYAVLAASTATARVVVLNKIDLPLQLDETDVRRLANGYSTVKVSAKLGIGLAELRRVVIEQIAGGSTTRRDAAPVLTNMRHRDALVKAAESLRLARESICGQRPPDIVAVDVQDAIDHIGGITGAVTSDEVLDHIFSRFCIGK